MPEGACAWGCGTRIVLVVDLDLAFNSGAGRTTDLGADAGPDTCLVDLGCFWVTVRWTSLQCNSGSHAGVGHSLCGILVGKKKGWWNVHMYIHTLVRYIRLRLV